jgi:D-glycero-alpha-D-manno-heptose-7-phosphate kinase
MGYGCGKECRARVCCRIDLAGGWSDVPEFADEFGGEVVSVGVDRFVEAFATWPDAGFDLRTQMSLPADTHLGSSASADCAFLAVTLALIGRLRTDTAGRTELAEKSFRLEGLIGEKGGKQDHYGAAFGGVHHYRFGHQDSPAEVYAIETDETRRRELRAHLLLWYTEISSGSGDIHSDVWDAYRGGDRRIEPIVRELRDSCGPMRQAIERQDYATVGELLRLNRRLSASIDPRVEPRELKKFFDAADAAGAWGGKACGVGGGGCIALAADPAKHTAIREALGDLGGYEVDFAIADTVLPEPEAS